MWFLPEDTEIDILGARPQVSAQTSLLAGPPTPPPPPCTPARGRWGGGSPRGRRYPGNLQTLDEVRVFRWGPVSRHSVLVELSRELHQGLGDAAGPGGELAPPPWASRKRAATGRGCSTSPERGGVPGKEVSSGPPPGWGAGLRDTQGPRPGLARVAGDA